MLKILELMVWAKKRQKNLDKTELYYMVNNGLIKHKFESYLCLHEPSLRAFAENKELQKDIKTIAQKWLDVLHEFVNDKEYHLQKEEAQKELQKMRDYFEKIEVKK